MQALRQARGLSQYELAIYTDMTDSYYSKIESGTEMPTTKKIVNLLNYFGVGLDECVTGDDEPRGKGALIKSIIPALYLLDKRDLEYLYRVLVNIKLKKKG